MELDSFLFDDGWDDPKTLWGFHSGFPRGFSGVREAAARYGAAPGVWMSPWGGYGKPKQDRLTNGKAKGFETNAGGFALSGPVYYRRFLDTCLTMIRRYGVNQFKFDGTGNADRAFPGQRVRQRLRGGDRADRDAARREAGSLREPDDGHVSVAVLAALGGLDLARRRGPRVRGRRLEAAAVDHVPRCGHVRERR